MFMLVHNELFKAFRLKKIYLFMLVILIVEGSAVLQSMPRGPGHIFISPSSQSLSLTLLSGLPQLMMVYITIFLADILSDDYRNGTLKMSLLRPVDRVALLHAKLITLLLFIAAMLLFTIVSSYLAGTIAFGFTPLDGIGLILQSALLSIIPYLGFGFMVAFIAVVSGNTGVTVGAGLGLLVVSPFIDQAQQARDYFIVHQMYSFHHRFINDIVWNDVWFAASINAGYMIVFYTCSMLAFTKRDILL